MTSRQEFSAEAMTAGQKVFIVLLGRILQKEGGVKTPPISMEELENIYLTGRNPGNVLFRRWINIVSSPGKGLLKVDDDNGTAELTPQGKVQASREVDKFGGAETAYKLAMPRVPA